MKKLIAAIAIALLAHEGVAQESNQQVVGQIQSPSTSSQQNIHSFVRRHYPQQQQPVFGQKTNRTRSGNQGRTLLPRPIFPQANVPTINGPSHQPTGSTQVFNQRNRNAAGAQIKNRISQTGPVANPTVDQSYSQSFGPFGFNWLGLNLQTDFFNQTNQDQPFGLYAPVLPGEPQQLSGRTQLQKIPQQSAQTANVEFEKNAFFEEAGNAQQSLSLTTGTVELQKREVGQTESQQWQTNNFGSELQRNSQFNVELQADTVQTLETERFVPGVEQQLGFGEWQQEFEAPAEQLLPLQAIDSETSSFEQNSNHLWQENETHATVEGFEVEQSTHFQQQETEAAHAVATVPGLQVQQQIQQTKTPNAISQPARHRETLATATTRHLVRRDQRVAKPWWLFLLPVLWLPVLLWYAARAFGKTEESTEADATAASLLTSQSARKAQSSTRKLQSSTPSSLQPENRTLQAKSSSSRIEMETQAQSQPKPQIGPQLNPQRELVQLQSGACESKTTCGLSEQAQKQEFVCEASQIINPEQAGRHRWTKIEGIDERTEQLLYRRGYHRYEDIEAVDPRQLKAELQDDGLDLDDKDFAGWVRQAKSLSQPKAIAELKQEDSNVNHELRLHAEDKYESNRSEALQFSQAATLGESCSAKSLQADAGSTGSYQVARGDDLTQIHGIKPATAKILNRSGIRTFQELKAARPEWLEKVLESGGADFQLDQLAGWSTQASFAIENDWSGLKLWQQNNQVGAKTERILLRPAKGQQLQQKVAAASSASTGQDDLTRINGIGPATVKLLKDAGIRTFGDLRSSELNRLQKVLQAGGSKFQLVDATSWSQQSEFAFQGDWDGLKQWQQQQLQNLQQDQQQQQKTTSVQTQSLQSAPWQTESQLQSQRPTHTQLQLPLTTMSMIQDGEQEDLTVINGIGVATQKLLNAQSVHSLQQISQLTGDQLANLIAKADETFQPVKPHTWPQQAQALLGESNLRSEQVSDADLEKRLLSEIEDISSETKIDLANQSQQQQQHRQQLNKS